MDYRKALRKRKHLEEEEEEEKRHEEADYSSDALSSEASSSELYIPGPKDLESSSTGSVEEEEEEEEEEEVSPLSGITSSEEEDGNYCCSFSFTTMPEDRTRSPSSQLSPAVRSSCEEDEASASSVPHRVTAHRRRKKRAAKDRALLEASQDQVHNPGDPCKICGHRKHLLNGHAFFQGKFFCALEGGPCSPTAHEWLAAQEEEEGGQPAPRTTLWRKRKRQAEELAGAGKRKRKRKEYKIRTCQKCGQPAQKLYGHSQHILAGQKKYFCALYEGTSVELWLAQRRAGQSSQ